ncbi:unnamed protein product [Callosobruchus maculatus]|uniref:Uncharacterized protein n=1 Tax=Callosobruchus maculatus TaxID=64391 RepID=A0A653CFJ7_CALMS|nr:unnamed protein product [Callosobruchus maculatus]
MGYKTKKLFLVNFLLMSEQFLLIQRTFCVVGAKVVYFYIYCIFGNIIFCYLLKTHPKYNVVTLNVTKN